MTITNENSIDGPYTPVGGGGVGPYSYTFRITADTEIEVIVTSATGVNSTLTITTQYTVAGAGDDAGGTVTLVNPPGLQTGELLTLKRKMPFTQTLDVTDQGGWDPAEAETALDRLVMQMQQLREELDRSFQIPVGSTAGTSVVVEDYINRPTLLASHSVPLVGPAVDYLEAYVDDAVVTDLGTRYGYLEFEFAVVSSLAVHTDRELGLQLRVGGGYAVGGYRYAMRAVDSAGLGTNIVNGAGDTQVDLSLPTDFADAQTFMSGSVRMPHNIPAGSAGVTGLVDVTYQDPAVGACTNVRGGFQRVGAGVLYEGFRIFLGSAPVNLVGTVRLWGHPIS